jgi:hypothetical protein
VHEHVIASLARDEAEASVCIEELHCALHNYNLRSIRTALVAIRAAERTPLRDPLPQCSVAM